MRKWKKKIDDDDDTLTFDDLEDDEDEEEEKGYRKRTYSPPRPIRTHYHSDYDDDDDERDGPTFDELEPKIRAGKYKPKKTDPWNAIVLYNLLKESGDI